MIEFAIVLVVLVPALLLAIDMGRVFFAAVGLRSMAEFGARYVASFPTKPDATIQSYVLTEPAATIDPADVVGVDIVPAHGGRATGSDVTVTVRYRFTLIAPFSATALGLGSGDSDIEIRGEAVSVVIGAT